MQSLSRVISSLAPLFWPSFSLSPHECAHCGPTMFLAEVDDRWAKTTPIGESSLDQSGPMLLLLLLRYRGHLTLPSVRRAPL